jgi:hypothetical protein
LGSPKCTPRLQALDTLVALVWASNMFPTTHKYPGNRFCTLVAL